MFGRPRGLLGRLGGIIMARAIYCHAAWVIDLLNVPAILSRRPVFSTASC
jgi:hypothetical protein